MSWLFDTGAAITCMNSQSLSAAFGMQKPRKISNPQSCVAASGDAMNSIGVYEVDLWIKGQKFTHLVNMITELKDNIIGIDFMHRNKLIYDVNTRQVKFADAKMNTICAMKQVTILAMTSSMVTAKFNRETHADKTYVATIQCPGSPTLTGVPSLVSIDDNKNCKIITETCAPYEVTIERNDIMGIVEIEDNELYPLMDDTATKICASIKSNIPITPQNKLTRDKIARHCNLQVPDKFRERYIDILFKHQDAISLDKYDLGLARNYQHKIYLKNKDPVYRKQFKIPEAHHQFIEQTLEEWLIGLIIQLPPYFVYQRNQDKDSDCASCTRAEPKFPHRQILCEGDHRVHWRHRTGQLQNLLHIGSHIQILADETGRKISAAYGFHHSRQRTIPLDHITNGTPGLPDILSMTHGRNTLKPPECDHLHRRPPSPLRHS